MPRVHLDLRGNEAEQRAKLRLFTPTRGARGEIEDGRVPLYHGRGEESPRRHPAPFALEEVDAPPAAAAAAA